MQKKIYFFMALLASLCLLATTTVLYFVFLGRFSGEMRSELRERAQLFAHETAEDILANLESFQYADMRTTLIAPNGGVLYDNTVEAQTLPNHLGREEVEEALLSGFGESDRHSDTLQQQTYYAAVRLEDGAVLRVAKTTSSIFSMFASSLPAVFGVLVLMIVIAYILSAHLTRRIIAPIQDIDLDTVLLAPYDELASFVLTIERQRSRIESQMADMKAHANTINAIMSHMNEGLILVDCKEIILSINQSAASVFRTDTKIEGRHMLTLTRDMDILEKIRGAFAGVRSDTTITHDGRIFQVFFSPAMEDGAIVLLLDITERAMREQLRREFTANVSHELKTPLTCLYGYAEMLAGGMVMEEDKLRFYQKIQDEASRLITLIEDIMMISELDEGKGQAAFEDVDLSAVVAETVETLRAKATEHQVSLQVSGESVRLRANRTMMTELLFNLLDNAIKYNVPGGTVTVHTAKEEQHLSIWVKDTGIGIPKEAQDRVFERFYRVDKSRLKKTGGTGLGLAIVKHIVLMHGGEIALESAAGKGTTIRLTLPV